MRFRMPLTIALAAALPLCPAAAFAASEESPAAERRFEATDSRRLLYEFNIQQNGTPMSDQVFLARIGAVDPAFAADRAKAYWPGSMATLGVGTGLALAAAGGLLLFLGGTNTTFEVAQGGVYQTKPVEMPLASWSAVLSTAGQVGLYGGAALGLASAPALVWFNYLSPPPRQFNLIEAKRAAAKYNARYDRKPPIEVTRPAQTP